MCSNLIMDLSALLREEGCADNGFTLEGLTGKKVHTLSGVPYNSKIIAIGHPNKDIWLCYGYNLQNSPASNT